jgi:hypothetical protein
MKKRFGQGIASLIAVIGLAMTAEATASASTVIPATPTGSAPHGPVSQRAAGTKPAGLSLVPVANPAVLAKRPPGVSIDAAVYVLRSGAGNNLCLDADTGTLGGNGTKVQLWPCTYQAPGWPASNQLWWLTTSGTTFIQNNMSGRCLDADRSDLTQVNGVKVQLWDCVTTTDPSDYRSQNQVWVWGYWDGITYPNQLVNYLFGSCLNADGATQRAKVHLWSCSHGGARDQWYPGL